MYYSPGNTQREAVGNRRNEGGLVKQGARETCSEQDEEQMAVLE